MITAVAVKVTPKGVLVPRSLIAAWGDVKEVEIEQHADSIVIKPRSEHASLLRAQILSNMKAAGLIEDLPWAEPAVISPEKRAYLAKKSGDGKPLSEIIIEDREDSA